MTIKEAQELYPGVEIVDIIEDENSITVYTKTISKNKKCVFCNTLSNNVHKYNSKVIQDLPINQKTVWVSIELKLFLCKNPECSHKSFTELVEFADHAEKKTKRLTKHIIELVRSTSYRKAGAILKAEGIKINPSTAHKMEQRNRT